MDKAAEDMDKAIGDLQGEEASGDTEDVNASTTMIAQAEVQEFNMLMNAATTMLKTLGTASGQAVARQ